jgi:small subunit ribosomal protein S17
MSAQKEQSKQKEAVHRQFEGVVSSVAEDKTVHVVVKTMKMHPKYKKQYATVKKYAVHDEKNESRLGDSVLFEECRPISKTKRWRLVRIKNAEAADNR